TLLRTLKGRIPFFYQRSSLNRYYFPLFSYQIRSTSNELRFFELTLFHIASHEKAFEVYPSIIPIGNNVCFLQLFGQSCYRKKRNRIYVRRKGDRPGGRVSPIDRCYDGDLRGQKTSRLYFGKGDGYGEDFSSP